MGPLSTTVALPSSITLLSAVSFLIQHIGMSIAYKSKGTLKGGGHAKKFFLIFVSNGQLKCEIMKYAFLKFFIP